MKYTFHLERNIFMYNHKITCTCDGRTYECICESAPRKEETIIFWPDDFQLPDDEKEIVIRELIIWSKKQGFECIVQQGRGR